MSGILATVLKGELRYHLRDPVTLLLLVVVPLVVYPLMLLGMGKLGQAQTSRLEAQILSVAGPPEVASWIEEGDHLRLTAGGLDRSERPEKDAVLVEITPREGGGYTLLYRGDVDRSRRALKRATTALERWQAAELEARFEGAGLSISPGEVLAVKATDVAPAAARTGDWLGRLIPVILVFLLSSGALHTALDVFTGEKDRGTIESLLTTRADRRQILMGKFAVVLMFTLVSGLLALISLWGTVALGWVKLPAGLSGEPVNLDISLRSVAVLALMALPLTVQLSAALTALAAWAPDFRSGQALALPVVLVPAALAGVGAIPEVELTAATALLPIGNIGLAARGLLSGGLDLGMGAFVLVATAGHAALALWFAARLLAREDLILGYRSSTDRRARGDFLFEALALFALALLLMWFLGQLAQARDMLWGMVFTQLVLMALPALGMLVYLGRPARETLQLRLPAGRDLALAVGIGALAPAFSTSVGVLQESFLPSSSKFLEQFADALHLDQPLGVTLVIFALLPGICEELLFRGAILGLLRGRLGPATRIILTGFLFGFLHLSVNRLLPTGLLGVLLGVAAWRSRSLLIPMIIHVLHNSILLAADDGALPFFDPEGGVWAPLLAGAAAWALVALVGRGPAAPEGAGGAPPG